MAERKDLVIKTEEFPSNSFKSKEGKKKVIERVEITQKVKQKKKPLGRRLAETFFDDDTKSVGQYIIWDVLIPAAKSTISDIVTGGIEMLLYGEGRDVSRGRTKRDKGRSYVSYSNYYERDEREKRRARAKKNRHEFDDILLFDSRRDAENVLSRLIDLLDEYDEVSVSDLYEMIGLESNYTDRDWGWTNLRGSYVERTRDGYVINLPRTEALDVPW